MHGRPWSEEERLRLSSLFRRGCTRHTIARELGRSPGSVNAQIAQDPLLRRWPRRRMGYLFTGRDLAKLLGVCETTVERWCREGELTCAEHEAYTTWVINANELRAWLADPESWYSWQPELITEPNWRQLGHEIRDGWYDTTRAAGLLGISRSAVHKLFQTGRLTGRATVGGKRVIWFHHRELLALARQREWHGVVRKLEDKDGGSPKTGSRSGYSTRLP